MEVIEKECYGKVSLTAYMKSRRYNHKLYSRLIAKIEYILQEQECNADVDISMSAKYQTPYVVIRDIEYGFQLEQDIIDALDGVGFTFTESEEKSYGYVLHFSD